MILEEAVDSKVATHVHQRLLKPSEVSSSSKKDQERVSNALEISNFSSNLGTFFLKRTAAR